MIKKTNPEMQESAFLEAGHQRIIWMRTDRPELPFHDIRVRQALAMAIDNQAIKDTIYGGNAELLGTPVAPYAEFLDVLFTPLEELPRSVQELYEYHPEKAKELLAEAGYPDGFKAELICYPQRADLMSVIASYWANIGVDLDIQVKEYGVWNSIRRARSYKEMFQSHLPSVAPYAFNTFRDTFFNASMIDDPRCNKAWEELSPNVVVNNARVNQILKEIYPYILEQAWYIETPGPYLYTMYQPWVKRYHGEHTVGYNSYFNFIYFIWVDKELKEEMTGRR